MVNQEYEAGLYAVVPASVLYDPELRPNAKLAYGVITILASKRGYCWASNAVIGEPLGLSKRTMEDIVRQLKERGHIAVEVELDPETKEVSQRRLWVTAVPGTETTPPREKGGTSPRNHGDPPREIAGPYKVDNTSILPPIVPQGDSGSVQDDVSTRSVPRWRPDAFEDFWSYYRKHCRGENRKAACRAWDKLRPTPELLDIIYAALRVQVATREWQRGIGVPYCSSYLNGRRWEDVTDGPGASSEPDREESEDGWE